MIKVYLFIYYFLKVGESLDIDEESFNLNGCLYECKKNLMKLECCIEK